MKKYDGVNRRNRVANRRHGTPEKIETIINTTAIALTTSGVVLMQVHDYTWSALVKGFIFIGVGMSLEYFKYVGRSKGKW